MFAVSSVRVSHQSIARVVTLKFDCLSLSLFSVGHPSTEVDTHDSQSAQSAAAKKKKSSKRKAKRSVAFADPTTFVGDD